MNADETGEWDCYFKLRDVGADRYSKHKLANYIHAYLPTDRAAKIVDLGCGYGQNLSAIKRLGYTNCLGVEPSLGAVTEASAAGLKTYRGTIPEYAALCPRDASFVLMTHVLEHIQRDEIIGTLKSIKESILAPGGSLLIAVPNASSPTHCYWRYEDWTHTCLFTSGSLLYVLRAAGFSQITILDPDCMMEARWFSRLPRSIALLLYKFWIRAIWKITCSSLHQGSPLVLSFEVKALAKA
jgi:SAM-dependent methyltransferase